MVIEVNQETNDALINKLKENLHPDYLIPDDILVTEMTNYLNSITVSYLSPLTQKFARSAGKWRKLEIEIVKQKIQEYCKEVASKNDPKWLKWEDWILMTLHEFRNWIDRKAKNE